MNNLRHDVQTAFAALKAAAVATRKHHWQHLTGEEQRLWHACEAAVQAAEPGGLEELWTHRDDEGIRRFVTHEYGETCWRALWGLVACAQVAVCAKRFEVKALSTRAQEAVAWLEATRAEASLPALEWTRTGVAPTQLVTAIYRALQEPGLPVGRARDLTLALLGSAPGAEGEITSLRIGVLGYQRTGFGATLELDLLPAGAGECYPDPRVMAFVPMTEAFRDALATAWRYAQTKTALSAGGDVRWRLRGPHLAQLDGASIGAAAAVALRCLLEEKPCQAKLAITGAIDAAGHLLPVQHVSEKLGAALREGYETILVPKGNEPEARATAPTCTGLRPVATVDEAVEIASGLLAEVLRYLRLVREEAEQVRLLPHTKAIPLEQLYIPVKVSQRRIRNLAEERVAEGRRLRGEEWTDRQAYALRGEESFQKGKPKSEEVILPWDRARRRFRKAVVLGDPGQGKTTLLRWELWKVAADVEAKLRAQQIGLSEAEVPFYLRLAELAQTEKEVPRFIEKRLGDLGFSDLFRRWMQSRLEHGQAVLLLDALDEVHEATHRATVKRHLETLILRVPHCRYLVTSRIVGYDGCAVDDQGKALELVLFGDEDIERFARVWFGDNDTKQQFLRALRSASGLRGLARNPLMLALLCGMYDPDGGLPERTTDLYRKCMEGFLCDWRRLKGLARVPEERFAAKLELLEDVALTLWEEGKEYFSGRELAAVLARHPNYARLQPAGSERSLIAEMSEEDGIVVKAGTDAADVPYMFLHLTLQEYLAACALARRRDWPRTVERWLTGPWEKCATVLVFLSGVLEDASPFIKLLLAHDDLRTLRTALRVVGPGKDFFGNMLLLAARCAHEAKQARDDCLDDICRRADHKLGKRGSYPQRKRAAQALAWIGSRYPKAAVTLVKKLHATDADVYPIARAIGEVGHPHVLFFLIDALRGKNPEGRIAAAWVLGLLRDSRAAGPLLKSATRDRERGVREEAASALAFSGDGRAVQPLLKMLRARNPSTRRTAAVELGRLGDGRAAEHLLDVVLHDKEPDVREGAALALGCVGDERVVGPLIEATREKRRNIYLSAIQALGMLGDRTALETLAELLHGEDWAARFLAAEALGRIADRRAAEAHIDEHWGTVRYGGARRVGETGDARALQLLMEALREGNADIRQDAAQALGQVADAHVVEALIESLHDWDRGVRLTAASSLEKIGDHRAIGPLCKLLSDADDGVRFEVAKVLGKWGDGQAVEPLCEALRYQDEVDRKERLSNWIPSDAYVAEALGKLGDQHAVEPLCEALDDKDEHVRKAAAKALGELGHARAFTPLQKALRDADEHVREAVAESLGRVGDPRAVKALGRALRDKAPAVRKAAAAALGHLGDARALEPLRRALRDHDKGVRNAATEALGRVGDRRAVGLLLELLRRRDNDVRSAAVEALEKIDRRMREKRERIAESSARHKM